MIPGLATGVVGIGSEIIKRIWPDPAERAKAEVALTEAREAGRMKDVELQLSAIVAEATSKDPWTSRARPTFLYVVYIMILASIPMGLLSVWSPETVTAIGGGMALWLNSIPEAVWTLFGVGYLGYTGARTVDKRTKLKAQENIYQIEQTSPQRNRL